MRTVPVSTTMFWDQVFEEKQPRRISVNVRHWISLLLQLLLLSLLVLARAEPRLTATDRPPRQVIVVLDNSASMQAEFQGKTRFESATSMTGDLIGSLDAMDQMSLVVTSPQPRAICGFSGSHRILNDALESVTVTDAPADLENAIQVACRQIEGQQTGQIVVLSDERPPDVKSDTNSQQLTWLPIGDSRDNVAITQFQVRRSLVDSVGFHAFLEVANLGETAVETRLELTLNDQLIDVMPLKLQPQQVWTDVFEQTAVEGGVFTVRVVHPDGLEIDNQASAILPATEMIPVILVSKGQWFLQQVLDAQHNVELAVTDSLPESLPTNSVLVLDRPQLSELPEGNVIVIHPEANSRLWEIGDLVTDPLVARQAEESALLRHVDLSNVLIPAARQIQPLADCEVLIEAASGAPLYLRFSRPEGDVLVLTMDLNQGDLPLRTAFPILMANVLDEYSGMRGRLQEAVSTGRGATFRLPADMTADQSGESVPLVLQSPTGKLQRVVPVGGLVFADLSEAGIWKCTADTNVVGASDRSVLIASNLTNIRESNLRVADESDEVSNHAAATPVHRPPWFYLLAVAVLLTGLEWYGFHRRWVA